MSGKRLKTAKKALSLIFVLLLSINSFAAVVSDNDGSAFITKAEFDSLKNDFQAQINVYNTNIDSKIDEAIAAYLSGIKVAKEYQLYLDPNCKYTFPLYYDPNQYWDNYDISGGYKLFQPEFHLERYGQAFTALMNPGNSARASWGTSTSANGSITLSANTWPSSSTTDMQASFCAFVRNKMKYDFDGKHGLLNIVKRLSSTRKVNGTNYTLYKLDNEGIGKLVHVYETVVGFGTQGHTMYGSGSSAYSTGASVFLGIAQQQYGVTGSGTSAKYSIKDPSSSFTRAKVTKTSSPGRGPSWVNQANLNGLGVKGDQKTCEQIAALEFTSGIQDTANTGKSVWGEKPLAEASSYEKPNQRNLIFSRDTFIPVAYDYDYALTADLQKGVNTIYTIAGGGKDTLDHVIGCSFRTGTFFTKTPNKLLCVPPLKTWTWHSNTKYAPATTDQFSYLPATLVTYTDKNDKTHYMDEGMYLGKMDRDGEVNMNLKFKKDYGSGSQVELHISKKPFSYDFKDTDLVEYTISTTKGKNQRLDYDKNYQVRVRDVKKGDELYLEWAPTNDADLSALSSFSDFMLKTND